MSMRKIMGWASTAVERAVCNHLWKASYEELSGEGYWEMQMVRTCVHCGKKEYVLPGLGKGLAKRIK